MANSPCYSVFFRAKNKAKDDAKDDAKHSAKGVQDSVQDSVQELGPDGGCNRLTVNGQCRKCRKKETFSQIILAITRYFRIFAHKFGMSTTKDTVMKRILNLLIALAAVTTAMAATVNRQQARQQAAQFLQQRGAQLGSDPTTVNGRRVQAADQSLYVFNAEGGRGFVVVSGDDRTDAILGYTLEGSYDEADMPPAFMEWLAQMEAEIKALGDDVAEARTNAPKASATQVSIHAAIAPLIQTTWNQGNTNNTQNTDGIYNIRLPKIGERYPCTGCVATAGAQIMYYYRWPQGPTAEVPGYTLDPPSAANTKSALPSTQFQWNLMKTVYSSADANTDAAKAVAELMLYAGYAAQMRYGVDGSSANQMTLCRGMAEYFGYDPYTLETIKRSEYSIAAWDEAMYNEIAHGRPIIYDGASAANGSGGHAFICDGYDGEGLYHFNWGWGGGYNGYFKLSATNPYGANSFPGYVFGNSAVIGIQPATGVVPTDPNGDDEWEVETIDGMVAQASNVSINGTEAVMSLGNPNEQTCKFSFGMGELKSDGSVEFVYKKNVNYSEIPQGWSFSNVSFDFAQINLPEGSHRLVPISKLDGEDEWRRCRPADVWFFVEVAGSDITAVAHPIEALQINKFELATPGSPDAYQRVLVNITNNGDNIEKTYYIYVDGEWAGFYDSRRTLKIAAGNTKEFLLLTKIMPEGKHTITLRDGYEGPVVAEFEADIKVDLAATAFSVGSDPKFAGTTLPVDVTVENQASDYTMPLYFFASKTSSKGSCAYIAGTGIPSGGSEDVRFYFTPTSGGTWNFWVATDQSGSNVIGTGSADIEEAPTGTVELTLVDKEITCKADGKTTFTITVKNTGNVTNYNGFRAWIYTPKNDGTNKWGGYQYQSVPNTTLEPGQEITVTMTFTELTEGVEYAISPEYATTYSGNEWTDLNNMWENRFTYTAPAVEPDPDPIPGDFDGDGELTVTDVEQMASRLIGGMPIADDAAADVNGDGVVNIADLTALIKALLKKGEQ